MVSTALSAFSAPFSNVPLAANTRYWIELSTSNGSLEWSYSGANDGIGVANEYNFYAGVVYHNADFTPYQMSIGSAVPEPSTWATMLVGFVGLGFARYRTSRKALSTLSSPLIFPRAKMQLEVGALLRRLPYDES